MINKHIDSVLLGKPDKLRDKLSGLLIGLPFFLELSAGGLNLPQNHFEMSGIPLHSSFLAILLLAGNLKINRNIIIFAFLFLSYFFLSLSQDISRALLAAQSMFFVIFSFILHSINSQRISTIALWAVKSLFFFGAAHLASITFSFIFASGGWSGFGNFWGLVIYQSFLTYPIVLIFAIWMNHFLPINRRPNHIMLLGIVLILEIMLLRRAAIAILISYLVFYRPKIAILILFPFLFFITIYSTELLSIITERTTFTRGNAWSNSIDILSGLNEFLFGNGLNNYSHNFYMHTLTTHGAIYSIVLFLIILRIMVHFFRKVDYSISPSLIIIAIVLIDWNVNANLYQPYYAAMLALAITLISTHYKFKKTIIFREKKE